MARSSPSARSRLRRSSAIVCVQLAARRGVGPLERGDAGVMRLMVWRGNLLDLGAANLGLHGDVSLQAAEAAHAVVSVGAAEPPDGIST